MFDPAIELERYMTFIHPHGLQGYQVRILKSLQGKQVVNRYLSSVSSIIAYTQGSPDTYAGVIPYKFKERSLAGSSWVLWVDVDTCAHEEQLRPVEGMPEASMVVRTGRGLHLYWKLDRPLPLDDVEAYNRGLSKALGGDHCWDRKRVLRLPTTVNTKTGAVCQIARYNNNARQRYSPDSFQGFYLPPTPIEVDGGARGAVEYDKMPPWWRSLVEHGWRSQSAKYSFKDGVLDRSHMVFNIVNVAKREGMTLDDIYELSQRGGLLGFEKTDSLSPDGAFDYLGRVYARCTPNRR